MRNGKFDCVLMNPPYGGGDNGGANFDMKFVDKCNKISCNLIVVLPLNRFISNVKIANSNMESHHLKNIDIEDANKEFGISVGWKYVGLFYYDNLNNYEYIKIKINKNNFKNIKCDRNSRLKFYDRLWLGDEFVDLIEKTDSLRMQLIEKYMTMVNDCNSFIYDENRISAGKKYGLNKINQNSLERVKQYLKSGQYKYCLYKGSFNHSYDEVQEWKGQDPDKLFKGQICWLMNSELVRDNMRYWMECPLFDLWKKYYLKRNEACFCSYGWLPALNFELPREEFKKFVNNLNTFSKEDIDEMKKANIHNIDKIEMYEN